MALPFRVEAWALEAEALHPDEILDLRQPEDFARGHLPGARNLPYDQLQDRAEALLRPGCSVLLVDPGGARAAEMALWLKGRGFDAGYLVGGMARWRGPLATP